MVDVNKENASRMGLDLDAQMIGQARGGSKWSRQNWGYGAKAMARHWGPALALGAGVGLGAAGFRKNASGETDWNRAIDTGILAGEGAYLATGILSPKTAARSYTAFAPEGELANWAKMAGKKGMRATSLTTVGWSTLGAITGGALTGASVFGDSEKNQISWGGAAGGAVAMGTLAAAYHVRLGGQAGIIRHAQDVLSWAVRKGVK